VDSLVSPVRDNRGLVDSRGSPVIQGSVESVVFRATTPAPRGIQDSLARTLVRVDIRASLGSVVIPATRGLQGTQGLVVRE